MSSCLGASYYVLVRREEIIGAAEDAPGTALSASTGRGGVQGDTARGTISLGALDQYILLVVVLTRSHFGSSHFWF